MKRSRIYSALRVCSGALFLSLCAPSTALACDTLANARLDSTCVVMPREGVQGVWFDVNTAGSLRTAKLEVPELRLQIEVFQRVEAGRVSESADLRAALQLMKESLATLEGTISAHVAEARRTREDAAQARSWYRSPWMLWGAGVASGALLAVVVTM